MSNEVLDNVAGLLEDAVTEHFNEIACDDFISDLATFIKDSWSSVSVKSMHEFLSSEGVSEVSDEEILEFIDDLNDKLTFQNMEDEC